MAHALAENAAAGYLPRRLVRSAPGGTADLRDPARWHAASTLAAADARDRFGMDAVVEQYEAFYARALGRTMTR